MRVCLFYHSLVSDWNHGNAHFLRGIALELQARGHEVLIFEPKNSWSRERLVEDKGEAAIEAFHHAFPTLRSTCYDPDHFDARALLDGADLILVHEWNDPKIVAAIGDYRRYHYGCRVLFHDTHHRALTAHRELAAVDLSEYDAVLAYGNSLKQTYEDRGWGRQVHVWHEAADTRTFYPRPRDHFAGDTVWIGNWGDNERSEELREFLISPIANSPLRAQAFGVRYPDSALWELNAAGIDYGGWQPNFLVPEIFSRFRTTIHVPRRPYTRELPGIPTIRPFEALACGIPLVSAPWSDVENLFRVGQDFLMARNGSEMQRLLENICNDESLAHSLVESGLETIRTRHTCGHRVDELLGIYEQMKPVPAGVSAIHGFVETNR